MKTNNFRSPLFYMGDKFKLLDQLKDRFPKKINNFIEPFTGGGSVFLNINANKYPPMTPAYVFFGLILVNLGPLNILPNTYPPMSVKMHINNIIIKYI